MQDLMQFVMSQRNGHDGIAVERMEELFAAAQVRYQDLRYVHITGTNGKGSTAAFVSNILTEAGYKVGTFSSPHVISMTERIVIGKPISEARLTELIADNLDFIKEYRLTFFEITFLLAVIWFLEEQVDYAVIEVGIGGRLDATNVITPVVCGITNVGLDHQGVLGDTKEEIAVQKIGIAKGDVPVFTTEEQESVLAVFHQYSNAVIEVPITKTWELQLVGDFQQKNASLAAAMTAYLGIDDATIRSGLAKTFLPGRMQLIRSQPQVYVDVAHNGSAIEQTIPFLQQLPEPPLIVLGANKQKDYQRMLQLLQQAGFTVIGCHFNDIKSAVFDEVPYFEDINAAYLWAQSQGWQTIIFTGSFYFIDEVIEKISEN